MSENNKKAVVAGASGLVGMKLVEQLLDHEDYILVQVLVRKKLPLHHPKLKQTMVDFEKLDRYVNEVEGDDLFCCLGTTIKKAGSQEAFRKVDYEYPVRLSRWAEQKGMKKFLVISALGADLHSSIFYSRVKGEMEAAVKSVDLQAIHIFQPSLLLGKREEFRLGERLAVIFSPLMCLLMVGKLKRYRPIEADVVAKGMLAAAQLPSRGVCIHPSEDIQLLG